ncbi:MAG: hypothetical protein ACE5HS_23230, partial [bacterium]
AERQNACLLPQHYAKVSREIFAFIQKAVQANLHPEFDCGFPYCFFDAEQRAFLEASGIEFASNCGVIPDIGPGFFITPCFPLARFSLPVSESHTWPDLQRKLECKLNQRPPEFLFDACESCDHLHENRCSGGCATFRLNA